MNHSFSDSLRLKRLVKRSIFATLSIIALFFLRSHFKDPSKAPSPQSQSASISEKSRGHSSDTQQLSNHNLQTQYLDETYLASLSAEELYALGFKIGELDSDLGIKILALLDEDHARLDLFASGFFEAWAKKEPESCFKYVSALWSNHGLKHRSQAHTAAKIWAKHDPHTAAEFMKELFLSVKDPSNDLNEVMDSLLSAWSEDTPDEAYTFLQGMPKEFRESPAITHVIENWAKLDPLTALSNAENLNKDGLEINLLYAAALKVWSESDPQQSAEWFLKKIDPNEQEYLDTTVGVMGQNLFKETDIETVIKWVEQIPSAKLQSEALTDMAMEWSKGERTDQDVLGALTKGLQSGNQVYADALYEAASALADSQPSYISEWINQQKELSEHTDPVIDGLLTSISGIEPFEVVFDWSHAIVNPNLRTRQQVSILKDWSIHDADGYTSWLKNNLNTLPPETKERLAQEGVLLQQ